MKVPTSVHPLTSRAGPLLQAAPPSRIPPSLTRPSSPSPRRHPVFALAPPPPSPQPGPRPNPSSPRPHPVLPRPAPVPRPNPVFAPTRPRPDPTPSLPRLVTLGRHVRPICLSCHSCLPRGTDTPSWHVASCPERWRTPVPRSPATWPRPIPTGSPRPGPPSWSPCSPRSSAWGRRARSSTPSGPPSPWCGATRGTAPPRRGWRPPPALAWARPSEPWRPRPPWSRYPRPRTPCDGASCRPRS